MKRKQITRREFLRTSLGMAAGAAAGSWMLSRDLAQAEQQSLTRIFEPTTINGLMLKNRLVRSATWEGMGDPEGRVTEQLINLHRRLADGGVGLAITGYMYIRSDGRLLPFSTGADRDDLLAGLGHLTDAVRARGGKIVAQICHAGGQSNREASGGAQAVAPSAILSPGYTELPRELSEGEIEEMISAFAAAARRVKAAGFDGVQLHGAHGYLISQFLSPVRNQRTDRYGGGLENRSRFALNAYRAVRAEVGPSYPVLIKLNAHDGFDGSTTERDAAYLASALAQAGIDAIEVSSGSRADRNSVLRREILSWRDEAYNLPPAKTIRHAAPEVPLMLVGGLRSLERMWGILHCGDVDYFSLSRPLIRHPDLPGRWAGGDRARSSCISCNGCFMAAVKGEGIHCVQPGA